MPLARASELDRLLACPGSAFLVREDLRTDYARGAAAWGDMVHAWVETGDLPPLPKDRQQLEERITLSGIDRSAMWPDDGEHEVALAYNVVSRVALAKREGTKEDKDAWKLSFGDEWITGSLDYAADVFGEVWVDDLKTGRAAAWERYKAQQTFYVLAWGLEKYGEVRRGRSTLTHWPRYPKHSRPNRFGCVLEVDALQNFSDRLVELRTRVLQGAALVGANSNPSAVLSLGEHCDYCPSRRTCPMVEAGEPGGLADC